MFNKKKFNKKLDIGVMLTLMGLPLVAMGILVATLLPLVQWMKAILK
jgi:hypothetical protein